MSVNKKKFVGVAASCLGAMSFAYCYDCLQQRAEPYDSIVDTYWCCDMVVADWVRNLATFKDGEYILVSLIEDQIIAEAKKFPPFPDFPTQEDFPQVVYEDFQQ